MTPCTLSLLAQRLEARVVGTFEGPILGAGTLEQGRTGEIGFVAEPRYEALAAETKLSVLICARELATPAAQLIVPNPRYAWQQVAALFEAPPPAEISPDAHIHPEAQLGAGCAVAAGAVIGRATLGAGCRVAAGAVIEDEVTLGARCQVAAGAKILRHSSLGARVFVDAGAVIGSRGFGYVPHAGQWLPVAQLGGVRIGDDVDIGANTTIDRGAIDDTILEDGVKLDNLIQVGHNVHIGAGTIIAGACVIAGSVRFGRGCVVGGASVFAGHIEICDGAQFAGHSSVSKSIAQPDVYCSALTVMPIKRWRRFVGKLKIFGREK